MSLVFVVIFVLVGISSHDISMEGFERAGLSFDLYILW
jgi:hypothetical protein